MSGELKQRLSKRHAEEVAAKIASALGVPVELVSATDFKRLRDHVVSRLKALPITRTWLANQLQDALEAVARLLQLSSDEGLVLFVDSQKAIGVRIGSISSEQIVRLADLIEGDFVVSTDSGGDILWLELNFYAPDGAYHHSEYPLSPKGVPVHDDLHGVYELRASGRFAEA